MKRKHYTLLALAIPFAIAVFASCYHEPTAKMGILEAYDKNKPSFGKPVKHVRDYNLTLDNEGYYLYDGERLVGRINYTGQSGLDSLIDKDNE